MLDTVPVRAFRDNYIWLVRGRGDRSRVAIVDPGDAAPVIAALDEHDLCPDTVLITHHHPDHTGGLAALRTRYSMPVYGPGSIDGVDHPVSDGDRVTLTGLDLAFAVLAVPGHTLDHIAYVGHGAVFCGDTLFSAGCGRLFEGTAGQMRASLARLRALDDDTQVFCAHEYTLANLAFAAVVEPGNAALADYRRRAVELRSNDRPTLPSRVGLEKQVNPFLRWDRDSVVAAAAARTRPTLAA